MYRDAELAKPKKHKGYVAVSDSIVLTPKGHAYHVYHGGWEHSYWEWMYASGVTLGWYARVRCWWEIAKFKRGTKKELDLAEQRRVLMKQHKLRDDNGCI